LMVISWRLSPSTLLCPVVSVTCWRPGCQPETILDCKATFHSGFVGGLSAVHQFIANEILQTGRADTPKSHGATTDNLNSYGNTANLTASKPAPITRRNGLQKRKTQKNVRQGTSLSTPKTCV
jgi:hypothetical protein